MKNLDYFMALPYRIEIQPIPPNRGGGYEASIPKLGRYSVCADGETIEEALNSLQEVKRQRLASYLEQGLAIPEPEVDDEDFSGKFVVRLPKSLHRDLSHRAKHNNVSLNQFIISLLSTAIVLETHRPAFLELQRKKSNA